MGPGPDEKAAQPHRIERAVMIRQRLPRGQGDELRAEIVAAAEELLLETGNEHKVSIRAVADEVGVTPPAIYMHFADKSELMRAVCAKQFADIDTVMAEAGEGAASPLGELYERGRAYIDFGLSHREAYRMMFMARPDSVANVPKEEKPSGGAFENLVASVARAIQSGELVADDPVHVAMNVWIAVHGYVSLMISFAGNGFEDVEALRESVLVGAVAPFSAHNRG